MEKTNQATGELKTEAVKKQTTDGMDQLQVANEEDPFHRLPNEIMVNILSRQADLKSLCRYSVVSKHFANAISGVRTVSVNLSGSVTYDEESCTFYSLFLHSVQNCSAEEIHEVLKQFDFSGELKGIRNLNLPSFLQKLTELESVYLEYDYSQNSDEHPFPMWKMNFVGGNGPKIKGLVALVPAGPDSVRIDSADREFLYGRDQYFEKASADQMTCFWSRYYSRYSEWLCITLMLAKSHPSLQRVTITDSGMHAKLVVEDELLDKFADTGYASDELINQVGNNIVRVARMPILHFPLSGYIMRWPCLVIVHAPDVDFFTSAEKLNSVMFGDCGDEFERLREAVEEVFENHAHKVQLWGSHTAFKARGNQLP